MDLTELLTAAGLGAWLPYLLAASGLAAWLVAFLPAPTKGPLALLWRLLNLLAANVKHARNAGDTKTEGKV